jgi:hypothetical protein
LVHWDGSTWTQQVSIPNGIRLLSPLASFNAVGGTDENHVWAVGSGGTIAQRSDRSWVSTQLGTSDTLYGLWVNGVNDVWAVGGLPAYPTTDVARWGCRTPRAASSGASCALGRRGDLLARQRAGPWVPVIPAKVGPSVVGGDTSGRESHS